MYQGHFHQVLTEEPCLQFVSAQHVAHHHVIGPVIPDFISTISQLPTLSDYDLVRIQEPRNLNRHFFAPAWGALDLRGLGTVMRHSQWYSAEPLDALANGVHDLALLFDMLVE